MFALGCSPRPGAGVGECYPSGMETSHQPYSSEAPQGAQPGAGPDQVPDAPLEMQPVAASDAPADPAAPACADPATDAPAPREPSFAPVPSDASGEAGESELASPVSSGSDAPVAPPSEGPVAAAGGTAPAAHRDVREPPAPAPDPSFSLGRFFKWGLAIIGLFLAVLGIEYLASVIILLTINPLNSLAASLGFAEGSWYEFLITDDGSMVQSLFIQLMWLLVMYPWWRHVRKRGIGTSRPRSRPAEGDERAKRRSRASRARRVLAVVMLGIGLQVVISIVLTIVLPLFPEVEESYDTMMEDSGTNSFSLLTVLSVAVAAPVVEEVSFRGVAFQFALRAVCPGWRKDLSPEGYADLRLTNEQFWAANILQAAVFGIMHLNITQGLYAFAIGLVCGWVFWRSGKLRWSMGLHAVLNFASYFVNEILTVCGLFGLISPFGEIIIPIVLTVWGIRLFKRGTEETALT